MSEQAHFSASVQSAPAGMGETPAVAASAGAGLSGSYDTGRLLDRVGQELDAGDDARLASALDLPVFILTKIRQGKRRVGATVLLRMQELTGISIPALKQIMGERRGRYRLE